MAETDIRTSAIRRPQDLVFTLFGEYLLQRPGPVWVGSLIALLEPFGLSQGAVRTVLSRMSRKGWLKTERRGRRAFYDLTSRGRRLLERGKARILEPVSDGAWDGRWLLLAYSIPEDVRHLRDRLRVRLEWLGFGSFGNGLWISPHDAETEVAELAEHLGIEPHVECFRARHAGDGDAADLVARCWNLAELRARLEDFVARWAPRARRCAGELSAGSADPEACFVLRFELIHEFRELALKDPRLPAELLPDAWPGRVAQETFHALHDMLVGPSDAYVDEVLGAARARSRAPRRSAAMA